MAVPVLIIGKSGSGKSTSMRNCVDDPNWNLIKVIKKPLPFRGKIPSVTTDNYANVKKCTLGSKAQSIVIDDAGYLITNQFMKGHGAGSGNAIFEFYNKIADNFWDLITFVQNQVPDEKIVYFMMHEETGEFGTKAKTIGKLLDEKVCVEGLFTIVLRCVEESGRHLFITQAANGAVSKSPMGMFDSLTMENDLVEVDKAIRSYYEMNPDEVEDTDFDVGKEDQE